MCFVEDVAYPESVLTVVRIRLLWHSAQRKYDNFTFLSSQHQQSRGSGVFCFAAVLCVVDLLSSLCYPTIKKGRKIHFVIIEIVLREFYSFSF